MLRLSLLLVVLTHPIRTTYVTKSPSFAAKLDRFSEKLEGITVSRDTTESNIDPWQKQLEKLNSLSPETVDLSDEDEELLLTMQRWGPVSRDMLDELAKELQRIREENDEDRSDYELERADYPDELYYNDEEDEEASTAAPAHRAGLVTPAPMTRGAAPGHVVVSAADPIAATNARPTILSDEALNSLDRSTRDTALANMKRAKRVGKCLVPQPRWLMVRQLAPAGDIVYMPPCVELHRCAPDSGCCDNEEEVCAPIAGAFVVIPFYLLKTNRNMSVARMMFYNHTECACVSRDTLQTTLRSRPRLEQRTSREEERQNDWNAPTLSPKQERERDEDITAPPQMRRCTCPGQFLANMTESGPCSCGCDWSDSRRRSDCLPLAKGDEHFGLRDRVCIDRGECTPPWCKYGTYDKKLGKCPARKYRRFRYHKRFHPDKALVV